MSYVVYSLVDQRDYTTRYVGITDDVYGRFMQHVRGDGVNEAKDAWIAELKAENVMLIMKTLETVETVEEAREREKHWIQHFRFMGTPLYNQQIPTIRISSTPKRIVRTPKFRTNRSGRKHGYGEVKEIVLYKHAHGKWPEGLSKDMQDWYQFYYFTKPKRMEKVQDQKKYEQHVKAYQRACEWIAELKAV